MPDPTVGSCGMDQMGRQPITNGQQCWLWSSLLFSPVGFWTPELRRHTFRYTPAMLVTVLLDLETGRVGSKLDHLMKTENSNRSGRLSGRVPASVWSQALGPPTGEILSRKQLGSSFTLPEVLD